MCPVCKSNLYHPTHIGWTSPVPWSSNRFFLVLERQKYFLPDSSSRSSHHFQNSLSSVQVRWVLLPPTGRLCMEAGQKWSHCWENTTPHGTAKILLGKGWQQQLSCDREVQEGFAQLFDVKMKMPQCTLYLQRTFLRYIPPLFNFLHICFGNLWVSTLAV